MESRSLAGEAVRLAAAGRGVDAIALLLGAQDDADALFVLAMWRIEGRLLARDLAAARNDLGRAEGLGQPNAARTLAGFLAAGVGGARDWAGAVALLSAWRGRDPMAERQLGLIEAMALTPEGDPASSPAREQISGTPEAWRFPALLTPAECAFLIEAAEARFKPALIFHEGQQKFVADPVRRSDAAGFPLAFEWPAIHAINRRLAAASGTDVRQGETLQVLRYTPGQEYRVHLDAIPGLANQRALTFLVYLSDGYQGGETNFTETGLAVKGRLGDGLLFRNALADGRPDPISRHAGNPVTSGIKIIASRWIRERPGNDFGPQEASPRR